MLSPGEYVVRASAVRNVGVGTLDAINQGANIATARTGGPIYAYQGAYVPAGQVITDPLQRGRQAENEKKRLEDQKQKLIAAGYAGAALVNIKPPYYIAAQELNKWQKEADANAARGAREEEAQKQRELTEDRQAATQRADFNTKRL
jgi:hypothetical protein